MAGIEKPISTALLLCLALSATAQDRPNEDALFGAPAPANQQPSTAPRDDTRELEPTKETGDAAAMPDTPDKPFQVGGAFYQRWISSKQRGVDLSDSPQSRPLQIDAFMDARPNDRVRAFVDGRWNYDFARDSNSSTVGANSSNTPQATAGTDKPEFRFDQAWLKFDVDRTVFITAGRQHIKWGTSRFWNPTDFINSEKRDSLATYDLRPGKDMIKFAVPREATQTNYYGIALFDGPDPGSTTDKMGGAFRAETVWQGAEVGADFVARGNRPPVYGVDISAPLGVFDVYGEMSLTTGSTTTYQSTAPLADGADISTLFTSNTRQGPFLQISGGGNYSFPWKANRLATVGAEYFYNPLGYDDTAVYPLLVLTNQYQALYTGKQYAALYLTAEGFDSQKKTSYTLSTLSNLSDKSYLSRLNFTWQADTQITFETYVQYHHGREGGEFTYALNTPRMTYQGRTISAINVPATVYDFGLGLRITF